MGARQRTRHASDQVSRGCLRASNRRSGGARRRGPPAGPAVPPGPCRASGVLSARVEPIRACVKPIRRLGRADPSADPVPGKALGRGTMGDRSLTQAPPKPFRSRLSRTDWTSRARPPAEHPAAVADGPGADPQLLHHRPHRPRQVDAGRPDAPDHRRGRRTLHARPVPRPHGHRARARHHHQVPGGPAAVAGLRRQDLHPQHDRHPRARRLHVRGVAVAGGVRGHGPAGRRRAGHRGADPGQPVPGHGERPADHPGAEQDRPAGRAAGEVRRGDGPADRLRARRRAAGQRQDRPGRPGRAQRGRQADPGPGRRPRRPGPRDDLRLGLRQLPRRGDLRPGRRRPADQARAHPDDVDRRHPRAAGDRRHLARSPRPRRAWAPARSAT